MLVVSEALPQEDNLGNEEFIEGDCRLTCY